MSVGECINLIRVNRMVNGLLDIQDFISQLVSKDQAMVVNESGMDSYAMPAIDQPTLLTFEFFHSRITHKHDPLMLPEDGDFSSDLRVISVRSFFCLPEIRPQVTYLPHRLDVKILCKICAITRLFGCVIDAFSKCLRGHWSYI